MLTDIVNLLKLDEQGRFSAIETGAKFPVDAPTYKGKCERCNRGRATVAVVQITDSRFGMTSTYTACAECYADFVASREVWAGTEIRLLPL